MQGIICLTWILTLMLNIVRILKEDKLFLRVPQRHVTCSGSVGYWWWGQQGVLSVRGSAAWGWVWLTICSSRRAVRTLAIKQIALNTVWRPRDQPELSTMRPEMIFYWLSPAGFLWRHFELLEREKLLAKLDECIRTYIQKVVTLVPLWFKKNKNNCTQ